MSSGARTGLTIAVVVILAVIAAFAFGLIDVSQTRDAKMPEIRAEGGQMPAFDVNTADVEVGTTTTNVQVPTVDVTPAD